MNRQLMKIAGFLSVVLIATGCSTTDSDEMTGRQAADAASADPSTQRSGGESGEPTQGDTGNGPGGHSGMTMPSSPGLAAGLVAEAALPEGYREGAGHHAGGSAAAAAPTVPAPCAPIAELIGTHPSVKQDRHPQVTTSFSKGHYGPSITESIVDFGDPAAASDALNALEAAGKQCDRYVQSTSPSGANVYSVQSSPENRGRPEVTSVRLRAVGEDFKAGIVWDIWAARSEGKLIAVAFRSALGGSNADLHAAFPAVMAAINEA